MSDGLQFLNSNHIQDMQQVEALSVVLQPHLLGKAVNRRALICSSAPSPASSQHGTNLSLAGHVLALCHSFSSELFGGLYINL